MKAYKRRYSTTAAAALLAAAAGTVAQAQSSDALIDKLVDKGILTVKEANDLREEADKGFTQAYQVKTGMPDWVTSMKFNGDFRGRYESFYADNPLFSDRHRFRYRLRAGFAISMQNNLEVGFRLGSGDLDNAAGLVAGTDPISNNQSFQNNGSKKGVFIDLAYAKWSPVNQPRYNVGMTLGKMENPFVFSDMVFDRDYTPEGAALQSEYRLNDKHSLKLSAGMFVLDEIGALENDPYLTGVQGRYDATWTPKLTSTLGAAWLGISNAENLTDAAVPNINDGNTRNPLALVNDYTPIVVDGSVTYTLSSFPLYPGAFPITLGAEYVNNVSADDANEGYAIGLQLGKSGKKGTWDLAYRWKNLEGDAWYEEMVDSDFGAFYTSTTYAGTASRRNAATGYRAGTNVRGHVVKASYSPYDSLTLSFTAFMAQLIDEPSKSANPVDNGSSDGMRFQVDAVYKF